MINNDGTDAVSGTFANQVEGSTIIIGGTTYTVTYVGGSGNDVALTAPTPAPSTPSVFVSQFRLSGPRGAGDEFIELGNSTSSPVDLGTGTWTLTPSSGTVNGVAGASIAWSGTIPVGGHLLITNSTAYSLGTIYPSTYTLANTKTLTPGILATGDVTYTGDIDSAATLTLKNGGTTVDTASFSLPGTFSPAYQYSLLRRTDTGTPGSFTLVDPNTPVNQVGSTGVGDTTAARLGAAGPRNLSSPPSSNLTLAPATFGGGGNPVARYAVSGASASALDSLGQISIRRTLTNTTGADVTMVRFRILGITGGSNSSGAADLRALSSRGVFINNIRGEALTLEAPSSPTTPVTSGTSIGDGTAGSYGGGVGSTWIARLPGSKLVAGASVNVEFLFGIKQEGNYQITLGVELK